jgi:hypothetical protein
MSIVTTGQPKSFDRCTFFRQP